MTKQTFYTATAKHLDGPTKTFFVWPDLRLEDDDRTADEIANAAYAKQGTGGVVEVSISYNPTYQTPSWDRTGETIRNAAVAIMRKDHQIASPWDVEVEVVHRIVVYKK